MAATSALSTMEVKAIVSIPSVTVAATVRVSAVLAPTAA
jgi:hypothetical protein